MSFEEDMIEEGFGDEQDYLDYLCSKADEQYRSTFYDYADDRDSQENLLRLQREREQLRRWKKNHLPEASLWEIIWASEHKYLNRNEYECWQEWLQSEERFKSWIANNRLEFGKLRRVEFAAYCNDYFNANTIPDIINNNCHVMNLFNETASTDCEFDDFKIQLRAWRDFFVGDYSSERILFNYWKSNNDIEWRYWLRVNYPRIKYAIVKSNKELSNSLDTIAKLPKRSLPKRYKQIVSDVVEEQKRDWWQLYTYDIRSKHTEAQKAGYDDLFDNLGCGKALPRLAIRDDTLQDIIFWDRELDFSRDFPTRPLSNPKLRRIKAVLPGSFREDLGSELISDNEEQVLLQEFFDFDSVFDNDPIDDDWSDIIFSNYETEEEAKEKKMLREEHVKSLFNTHSSRCYSQSFYTYLSKLPETSICYKEYEYLGHKNAIIFYFLRNTIQQKDIDGLLDGSIPHHFRNFRYKYYKNNESFLRIECTYKDFNNWCYDHHLPTFRDYLIKYWVENKSDADELLFKIWLSYWRGHAWISFNYEQHIPDKELFMLWKKQHQKAWQKWYKNNFNLYKIQYKMVYSFICWVQGEDYKIRDVLKQKGDDIIVKYRSLCREKFNTWLLQFIPRGIPFKTWKKEHASSIRLLRARYEKTRYLELWNKYHSDNKVVIKGLNG